MGVRLTADEAWEVLADAHTGIFTTLRRDGMPIALPVWFVAVREKIYLSGPARTKKVLRIRNDPRCSFLVESGDRWSELTGVQVNGTAGIVSDAELEEEIGGALDQKYRAFRTERSDMPDDTRRHYSVETALIEITPDSRILSWDNARLNLG